jgi:hypothetical protein
LAEVAKALSLTGPVQDKDILAFLQNRPR